MYRGPCRSSSAPGCFTASLWGAITVLVLSRVGPERRAYAVGVNNVAYVAGAFAGPLLAGVLADALGVRVALAGFAVAASLSAVYLVRNVPAGPRYAKSAPVWASLIGLRRLIRTRRLGSPLLLVLADITILHIWLVYLPLYFTSRHGFSLTAAGALISVEALSYAIAQPYWGRLLDRRGYRVPVYLSLLAHGLCISLVPLVQEQWLLYALLLAVCRAVSRLPGARC